MSDVSVTEFEVVHVSLYMYALSQSQLSALPPAFFVIIGAPCSAVGVVLVVVDMQSAAAGAKREGPGRRAVLTDHEFEATNGADLVAAVTVQRRQVRAVGVLVFVFVLREDGRRHRRRRRRRRRRLRCRCRRRSRCGARERRRHIGSRNHGRSSQSGCERMSSRAIN